MAKVAEEQTEESIPATASLSVLMPMPLPVALERSASANERSSGAGVRAALRAWLEREKRS